MSTATEPARVAGESMVGDERGHTVARGGGTCTGCGVGQKCKTSSDCQMGEGCDVNTMTCAATTCSDGVKNGDDAFNLLAFTQMSVFETISASSARALFSAAEHVVVKTVTDDSAWQDFSTWSTGCQPAGFNAHDPPIRPPRRRGTASC